MRRKRMICLILVIVILTSLIGCNDNTNVNVENNNNIVSEKADTIESGKTEETVSSKDTIFNANEIVIKEDLFSIRKAYSIFVNDKEVANVKGKFVDLFGEELTMTGTDDEVISSEKQLKRFNIKVNRLAELYDSQGNVTGYFGEEKIKDLFKIGYRFHFYDKEKNEIGLLKQDIFNLTDTFKIEDNNGSICYEIKQNFTLANAKYTIVVHDSSNIKPDSVIYLTIVLNEIKTAKANEYKNKNKNKKVALSRPFLVYMYVF